MQSHQTTVRGGSTASLEERIAKRQARVGIIANTVAVSIPRPGPREVWVRWPKLRSARRCDGSAVPLDQAARIMDPVLSGDSLSAFALEVREADADPEARLHDGSCQGIECSVPDDQNLRPPLADARPVIRVAIALLVLAMMLVVGSLLFD